MISWEDYEDAVVNILRRDIREDSNRTQNQAIRAGIDESLFLVAGPGTGKTTVLALRVLKLILVDSVDPTTIIATTFTRKAAAELRSRILGWGDELLRHFSHSPQYTRITDALSRIDINQIITGTLDSIAEDILAENRAPATPPPAVIEDFVARAIMLREGLFSHNRHRNDDLREYVDSFSELPFRASTATIAKFLLTLKDRIIHDQVDIDAFRARATHPGASIALDAVIDYLSAIEERLLLDFALLERDFFTRLSNGELDAATHDIRFLLVDEYQDTNLLQESIYFTLARTVTNNGGSITFVGDDDQSLFRFRGATVDLFRNLTDRIQNSLGLTLEPLFLSKNYRSTENIVDFCNGYLTLDADYQGVRVAGKPQLDATRSEESTNFPIFGMFRNSREDLARDLSNLIRELLNNSALEVTDTKGNSHRIELGENGGPSDLTFLAHSPAEATSAGRVRLPQLLRDNLDGAGGVPLFNPRGRSLQSIDVVIILCGLVLLCIDPDRTIQNSINIGKLADIFTIWRRRARDYIDSDPNLSQISLADFMEHWQQRTTTSGDPWPREIALMDLVYSLITWIPEMQNDVEGLVYLEAISRTFTQTAVFSNFGGSIVTGRWEESSIKDAYWNIFVPIASGIIEINEDLLETLPPNYLSIMSIHQSKGLEFPFTIVDVGSDYAGNYWMQARSRFPREGNMSTLLEDELRPCCPLGAPTRSALNRSFDDLYRLYFEAYSRAQDVLLLVGLRPVMFRVAHVATGRTRHGDMVWRYGLPNLVHL